MSKKMIILEGCDGTGKSTLARSLSMDLMLPVAERVVTSEGGPPSKHALQKWMYRELADPTIKIYDRFPIYSDPIYSAAMNRESHIGKGAIRHFHDTESPFLVLCDPGLSTVRKNVLSEPQMPGVIQNLDWIYTQYRKLHMVDFIFNHTSEFSDYQKLVDEIRRYIREN